MADHDCLANTDENLDFEAYYGAPGIGASYKCRKCGRHWSCVGGEFYDPSEGRHIMSAEDVI